MKKLAVLFAFILFTWISGCSSVTHRELVDLQSANSIIKQEAIHRISKGEGFPLNLIEGLVDRENERKAVAIMVELLRNGGESKDVELSLLKALGHLGKTAEVPASVLIEKLTDKDVETSAQAIEALAKMKAENASTALVKLLDTEETVNKYTIIWALGEIGDKRAIPTLNSLLASNDEYVRYNAYRALGRLGTRRVDSSQTDGRSDTSNRLEMGNVVSKALEVGKIAYNKYQRTMMVVFQKVRSFKGA